MLKVLALLVLIGVGLVEWVVYGVLTAGPYPGCAPVVLGESVSPTGMFRAVVKDFACKDTVEGEDVYIETLRAKAEPVCVGRIKREKGSLGPARVGLRWASDNTLVVEYANGVKDVGYGHVRVGRERVKVSFVPSQTDEAGSTAAQ